MVQSKQFYMGENFRRKNKLRLQESSRYKHFNQNATYKLSFLYYKIACLRSSHERLQQIFCICPGAVQIQTRTISYLEL